MESENKCIEAGNFGFRKNRNCTIHVEKTKALISCAVSRSGSSQKIVIEIIPQIYDNSMY